MLVRRLFRARKRDRELDAEIRFHFEEHVRELVERGVPLPEARRYARHQLGGVEQVKQRVRDSHRARWVEDMARDIRFALRSLGLEPGFASVAVLTLALGVGATTAIFSVAKPVLFDPLAYPDSDRIQTLVDHAPDGAPVPVAFGTYRELAERSRSFVALAVHRPWQPTLTGGDEPERLQGQRVSAAYFDVLGVGPAIGPGFAESDDRPSAPGVVIISHALWLRRFGPDPDAIGETMLLDGMSYTLAGVMPPTFENVLADDAQIWTPLQYDRTLPSFEGREWGHHLGMLGRLAVDVETARRDLDQIASNPVPEIARPPWADMPRGLRMESLWESTTAASRPMLWALLGAVALLLVIASVNTTGILLARGARRQGEFALRTALGAGRARLMRQVVAEVLVLAFFGGALGTVLAVSGTRALVALRPAQLARVQTVSIDPAVLGFAMAITLAAGFSAGLVTALSMSGRSAPAPLTGRAGTSPHGNGPMRRALVVVQVALALVLLVGAGLLMRSFSNLLSIDPGFSSDSVVVMRVSAQGDDVQVARGFRQTLESVQQLPGVTSAALTSQLPLSGDSDIYGANPVDGALAENGGGVFRYAVSPEYLTSLRIPLLRGRWLQEDDDADAPRAAVLSASLAARLFAGSDAIGQRLHVGRTDLPPYTVVGIVGNVRQASLGSDSTDAVYIAPPQWYFADSVNWYVVRTEPTVDQAALVDSIKEAIWAVDRDRPIVRVAALDELVARSESERRFALRILEAFGALALVLAACGVYGIVAGSVAERRLELGVRHALGASPRNVLALVVRQGMLLVGVGCTVGLAGAAFATELLTTLLFGISRLDPLTYVGVIAVLGLVSMAACAVPALRASRLDPVESLRRG